MRTPFVRPILVLVAIAASACNKNESNGTQSSATSSTTSSTTASAAPSTAPTPAASSSAMDQGPGRGPGHGGIDAMFFRATKDLTLTADQQTKIDALKGGLRDRDTGPQDAMKALRADLASEVRAGKLDPVKLKTDETAIDAAMTTMHDKQAKALDELHGVLDAGQRKAIVDALHARWAAHDKEDAGAGADAGTADWAKKRLDRLVADLGLDAAQQSQVAALIAKQNSPAAMRAMHDAMKTQMDALLTAFQGDTFDASKAVPTSMGAKTAHDMIDRRIALLTQLVPILHADQRDKLATQMEQVRGSRGYGPLEDQEESHEADERPNE